MVLMLCYVDKKDIKLFVLKRKVYIEEDVF